MTLSDLESLSNDMNRRAVSATAELFVFTPPRGYNKRSGTVIQLVRLSLD